MARPRTGLKGKSGERSEGLAKFVLRAGGDPADADEAVIDEQVSADLDGDRSGAGAACIRRRGEPASATSARVRGMKGDVCMFKVGENASGSHGSVPDV